MTSLVSTLAIWTTKVSEWVTSTALPFETGLFQSLILIENCIYIQELILRIPDATKSASARWPGGIVPFSFSEGYSKMIMIHDKIPRFLIRRDRRQIWAVIYAVFMFIVELITRIVWWKSCAFSLLCSIPTAIAHQESHVGFSPAYLRKICSILHRERLYLHCSRRRVLNCVVKTSVEWLPETTVFVVFVGALLMLDDQNWNKRFSWTCWAVGN